MVGPTYASVAVQNKLTFNKKCSYQLKFNSTNGGTVADLTSNNIGIMAIGSAAASQFLDMQCRIRFSDD